MTIDPAYKWTKAIQDWRRANGEASPSGFYDFRSTPDSVSVKLQNGDWLTLDVNTMQVSKAA